MTPEERKAEIIAILDKGFLRLKMHASSTEL